MPAPLAPSPVSVSSPKISLSPSVAFSRELGQPALGPRSAALLVPTSPVLTSVSSPFPSTFKAIAQSVSRDSTHLCLEALKERLPAQTSSMAQPTLGGQAINLEAESG